MSDAKTISAIQEQMAGFGYIPNESIREAVESYVDGNALNLCGQFGGGKSIFWKLLSRVKIRHERSGGIVRPYYFAVIPMARVASFRLSEIRQWLCKYEDWELVVDDLGSEPLHVSYGMRTEAIDLILSMRESSSKRTHFTTNIPLRAGKASGGDDNTIERRYGERICDRIAYANEIQFSDNSRRGVGKFRVPMNDEENYRILQLAGGELVERAEIPSSAKPKFNWSGEDYD